MNRPALTMTLLLSAALAASTGCSSVKTGDWKIAKALDVRHAMWWKEDEPEPQVPVRLVSTWTDTVLHRPGQPSQRGFGGRILFFGRESDDPVPVDGQLVVYAYDEGNCNPQTAQPTRRFIFPREEFVRHYSKSSLGPSYSVWLPWDEVGGPRKNISLIARFEPHEGQLIAGEQTRHMLPGTGPDQNFPAGNPNQPAVQLAQHTAATAGGNMAAPRTEASAKEMTTTSIHLSKQRQDRFASQEQSHSLQQRLSNLPRSLSGNLAR